MVKQTIQIFARVKPTKKPKAVYSVDCGEQGSSLDFVVPRDLADGFVNNSKENYKFRFQRVFDQIVNQEEIFQAVAKPVADKEKNCASTSGILQHSAERGLTLCRRKYHTCRWCVSCRLY
nr:kinesin-like protein KIF6 isoform X2 [Misgurnus anguillicaudatus]